MGGTVSDVILKLRGGFFPKFIIPAVNPYFKVIQKGTFREISTIAVHSQNVLKDSLFVALKGERENGHCFLKEAVQKGASVLLVEDISQVPSSFKGTVLKTEDGRVALSVLLNELYDFPSRKLFGVGVTGTNGKTSTSSMIEYIFCCGGWKTGLTGTIHQKCGEKTWPSLLTTPEPVELFERLNDFLNLGAKALVMEASSIGLHQKRLNGINFNICVFTNLSQDHIDYHKNIEDYFQSKKKLFELMRESSGNQNHISIINKDDFYGKRLLKELKGPSLSFGEDRADFYFKLKERSLFKTLFTAHTPEGTRDIELPLSGVYNISNAVAAIAAAFTAGFSLDVCKKALESFPGVPGRLERITPKNYPFKVFVDYAHTPDALRVVLTALRQEKGKGRLVTVFGCGGGRDREKRGIMTETALKLSDKVILTSDNPRWESSSQILNDCLLKVKRSALSVCWDRKEAIKESLLNAKAGDLILITGKGHESFQIIEGTKHPFSDKEVVKSFITHILK